MSTPLPEFFETVAPSEADSRLARESSRLLAARELSGQAEARIRFEDQEEPVVLPASVLRLLARVLTEMSRGNAVALVPTSAELSTQRAADLLCVSRPYVVKLLDEGAIPFRAVGRYRKVRFDDLMAYKRKDDEARERVLDLLAADTQDLEAELRSTRHMERPSDPPMARGSGESDETNHIE